METQRKESAESSGKTDRRKALESVGDLVKLQITLGTGTIVFSGSVLGNILSSESHTLGHQAFLLSSWAVLSASIFLGLWCLGRVAVMQSQSNFNLEDAWLSYPARLQQLTFFAGISLFAVFAARNL